MTEVMAARRRRYRRIRWLAAGGVLSIGCGGIERPRRVTIDADGMYGLAEHRSGCEDEFREEHRQTGGSVGARYEDPTGFVAGARVRVIADQVAEAVPDNGREGATDVFYGGGAYFGFDGAHIGGDFGGAFVHLPGVDAQGWPFLRLRAGDLTQVWGEGQLFSDDPLFVFQLAELGIAGRMGDWQLRAGGMVYWRMLTFSTDGGREPDKLAISEAPFPPEYRYGGYVGARYAPVEGLGVDFGALLGTLPAVRIGLSWAFGLD